MKQITVYGLLSKIYNCNGNIPMPKRIKYLQNYYTWFDGFSGNIGYVKEPLQADANSFLEINTLNLHDTVDILDDEIEKLDIYNCFHIMGDNEVSRLRLDENFQNISDKINQIIDIINEMKNEN